LRAINAKSYLHTCIHQIESGGAAGRGAAA
jgi:hypothetical protein